jgi:hypothetical protein
MRMKNNGFFLPQNLEPEVLDNNFPTSKNFGKKAYFNSYYNGFNGLGVPATGCWEAG